ncbi:MAG: hypothetical protein ACJ73N_13465 [Bryobacteraceae bacterium]
MPELAGLAPLKALEKLEARFEADPSAQNGLLLQAAMNRITTSQIPDEGHLKAVNRVAKLFSVEDTKNSPPLTDDIWYTAYEHADFGGRSVFEDMTPGWGYWRPDLGAVGMNDMISSIAYNSSLNEVGGASCCLNTLAILGAIKITRSFPDSAEKSIMSATISTMLLLLR